MITSSLIQVIFEDALTKNLDLSTVPVQEHFRFCAEKSMAEDLGLQYELHSNVTIFQDFQRKNLGRRKISSN